jgi:hypothetical protein
MVVARLDYVGPYDDAVKLAKVFQCDVRLIENVGPTGHMVVEFSGVAKDMHGLIGSYLYDDKIPA